MKNIVFLIVMEFIFLFSGWSQNATIEGKVLNEKNNEAVPFANILVFGSKIGVSSGVDGNFKITGLASGYIKLAVTYIGYEKQITEDILVTNAKVVHLDIYLKESAIGIKEVTVTASQYRKTIESPVSMRTINLSEIEKNPGANRDISKVIQSFPGVASTPSFRNDLIVRGGGTSENRFYLDGIEIPNINHFATQGASGGPVGMINVDFIREVEFYSGAFPAKRGNALSSIVEFKMVDGNDNKIKFRATVGASDLALTSDGPIGDKSTFIFSVRRSYLQFLFSALGLPFLPTYNDIQFKNRIKFNAKNELTIIGLGAYDVSNLNTEIKNPDETQQYILSYLPVYKQWNYTFGLNYKHYKKNGYHSIVLSRNFLHNQSFKYLNNNESISTDKILDYKSQESENKIRFENNMTLNEYKIAWGAGGEYVKYKNNTFQRLFLSTGLLDYKYNSFLDFYKYSVFGQAGRGFYDEKLTISVGARMDANSYSIQMSNLLKQFSPRFSLSYNLIGNYFINFNVGRYFQLPAYTTLGYKDSAGIFVNRQNNIKYISANHVVLGLEYQRSETSKMTMEGFYKVYDNYPFSVRDSVSLANKGGDFGTIGDEEVVPDSKGKTYGMEFLFRESDFKGFSILISYTFVRSVFTGANGKYIASAWDNKHLLNLSLRKSFKRNWNIGMKWRFLGGAPYTPYDLDKSSLRQAWDAIGRAYPDNSRFNSERLSSYHQLDLRIDKAYFFKKWSMMLYIDIQNLYNSKYIGTDFYVNYDKTGNVNIDPVDNSKYVLRPISNISGTILPSLGMIFEF